MNRLTFMLLVRFHYNFMLMERIENWIFSYENLSIFFIFFGEEKIIIQTVSD